MPPASKRALPPKRTRLPRGTLSSEQIVDAACQLAATVGLEAFSMSALARQLDVGVTSLYWHFRTKDELLRAIADRATLEFYAGLEDVSGLEGDDRVLHHFRVYWTRLRDNPLWREVFISSFWRTVPTSSDAIARSTKTHQQELKRMAGAGLSRAEAASVYTILSAYTRGYALVEHLNAADQPAPPASGSAPNQGDALRALAANDADLNFDTGLVALWRGLRQGRAAAG